MCLNILPKILIFTAICAYLVSQTAFGQAKPAGEIDVTKCWSFSLGDEIGSGLASDGVRVYLGGSGGRIEALSLDGKKMWATELGGDIVSNLLPAETGLFLVTATVSSDASKPISENLLRSLSKETGITNWTAKMPEASKYFIGNTPGAIILASKSGVIQSIDSKTGAVKWKREIADGFVTEPRFYADKLVVASTVKQVFVISLASGEIDSLRKLPFGVSAVGQTVVGDLIVGDERGNLTSFVGSTAKVNWKFRSGGEISAIFTVDDHILVSSHDNFAYSLVTRNGDVAWKRRLSGRVSQLATIEDKYALISSFDDHGAVLTDLSSGKIAGQIALGADENLIYNPIVANGLIFILTSESVNAFSLNGCSAKKESGPAK